MYIQSTFNQVLSFLIEGDRRYSFQTPHLSARPPRWYIISPPFTANRCQDHIPKDDVIAALFQQYDLWRMHLQGAFVRRILLEFDVDPARIESLVDDAIDGITSELNTRFEAEGEHG